MSDFPGSDWLRKTVPVMQHRFMPYRPDIDGLRAIAIAIVVIYHAFHEVLPGGFVGVDIFFVISGYLITSIIFDDLDRQEFSFSRFYQRRICRIFPALGSVLLVVLCLGWALLFRDEFLSLGKHIIASTIFAENFRLMQEIGYFDVSADTKPVLHLWSLAIEEQYYLFWPVILYLSHRSRVGALKVVMVLGILSFSINLFYVYYHEGVAYYSPIGRFWELMVGSGLACVKSKRSLFGENSGNVKSVFGMLLIILSLVLIKTDSEFPGLWAVMPTSGAALVICGGQDAIVNRSLLGSRILVWGGLISYPLYLWHWPLLSFASIIFPHSDVLNMAILKIGLIFVAIVISTLTLLFIECPFRAISVGWKKVVYPAVMMTAAFSIGSAVVAHTIVPRLYRVETPTGNEWSFLQKYSHSFDINGIGEYAFHTDRPHIAVFIGDSEIAQYAERLAAADANPDRLGLVLAIGGGCVPIDNVFTDDPQRKDCWELRARGLQIAREDRVRTVVIGGSWNWYFFDPSYQWRGDRGPLSLLSLEGREAALSALETEIRALAASGKHVYLLLGNPISKEFDPTRANIRFSNATRFNPDRVVDIDERQLSLRNELLTLAARAGAVVIDPFPLICDGVRCRVTTENGLPIFKDASHFNPDWARRRADFIDGTTSP
ncbi:MAG: acyltransferase family protein [Azospirillaceae bacterium]|nr:acyltransferase family protein [Azospirillaceae bacterium]